jgi:Putative Ig domain
MQTLKFFADRGHRRAAIVGLIGLCATLDAQAFEDWHWFGHGLQISGSPATSDATGTPYNFTPTTAAPRNTRLTYSISSKPAWASFSARTGQLAGTPATTNAGKYANIVITVSDGAATASLAPFSITVTSPVVSKPPTISGTPSTAVNVGTSYAFTPSSTDPSGKALTFSVKNAPSWTAFNTATGEISGTPGAAYAGTYANIVISVTDGTSSASLAPFSIAVNQASNGTATVNWTPPTDNSNGTALTNLAGYQIHYGTASTNLAQMVQVSNAGLTSYTLTNLTSGTWYFAVTAYTSTGMQSSMSNVASKKIQ